MQNYLTNIYLADDDPDDVCFFKYALENLEQDFKLNVALDGAELVEQLQNAKAPPDIILLDINMPRMNGLEALRKLREMPLLHSTPIIVYSTSNSEMNANEALLCGANSYLIKPSDINALQKIILKILTFNWSSFAIPKQIGEFVLRA